MMAEKSIVLVPGANTGLGLGTVRALYESPRPYEIMLGCRNEEKGQEAEEAIERDAPMSRSSLTTIQIDVTSDDSIQRATKYIFTVHGTLDVLVNNAGSTFDGHIASGLISMREDWNSTWDTNVVGSHIATHNLASLLLKSSDPRLLFLSSRQASLSRTADTWTQTGKRINTAPPAGWPKKDSNPQQAYRSSKTGLNMVMQEWYRLLLNDGVKVWAVSPGLLVTNFAGFGPKKMKDVSTPRVAP
jgi:NAD(P)-dependent dehydrogenase (short-subunit alcohol dehydrogenase family)